MEKINFKFENQETFSPKTKRRNHQSNHFLFGFLVFLVCFTFLAFHFVSYFQSQSKKNPPKFVSQEPAHIVPLLVNLKSGEGPQLARVNVYINLNQKEDNLSDLSQSHKLEKKLLFLLSGQPVSRLNSKDFQNQLQLQLNAFLSDHFIKALEIKTEMLN